MKNMLRIMAVTASVFTGANLSNAQWVQTSGPEGGQINCLAVNGTNLFAGTNVGGVFLSANNGTSWAPVNTGLTNKTVICLAVSGTNLFAGTNLGGVFLSNNNGTSWTPVNSGLTSIFIWSLAVSGTNLIAGTFDSGVFLSTNDGTSWTPANSGLTSMNIRSLAVSATNLFAGTNGGGVFMSDKNGTSWAPVNSGLTNTNVRSLTFSGMNLFAGTKGSGVFLSANNGTSWVPVNSGLTNTNILSLAASGTNLFAGTDGSGVWRRTVSEMITILPDIPTNRSPSDGAKDQPVNPTLEWNGVEGAVTYRLQVSTTPSFSTAVLDDSTLSGASKQVPGLAHTTKYFWHVNAKNSAGTSPFSDVWVFTTIPAAPSSPALVEPVDGAKDQPINPTLEWTGAEDAVAYRLQVSTTPSFSTTVLDDSTLTSPSREVGPLQINTDYYWRAAVKNEAGMSPYSPIWWFTTGTTGVLEHLDNSIPTQYMLEQNYPNPFNSCTTIRFSLPRAGRVTLKVFNMFGEELTALVSKELYAGTYTTDWDAIHTASGIYFYRLQSGDYTATKKLILLR